MSVEKYVISKSSGNFTTFLNNVLQNLHDLAALGLYCYLMSLPPGWVFHKQQLCKHARIGRDKINRLLKVLEHHNLVHIVQVRDAQGRFAHFDVQVKDGSCFKINNLEECVQPHTEKPSTDNQSLVNRTYKENKKKEINNKILSAPDGAQDRFEDFWKVYPKKRNRKRSEMLWKRQNLNNIADKLISDVQKRCGTEWKGKAVQYIPDPSTYINGERWQDDVLPGETRQTYPQPIRNNELRCTVPDFIPSESKPMSDNDRKTGIVEMAGIMQKLGRKVPHRTCET